MTQLFLSTTQSSPLVALSFPLWKPGSDDSMENPLTCSLLTQCYSSCNTLTQLTNAQWIPVSKHYFQLKLCKKNSSFKRKFANPYSNKLFREVFRTHYKPNQNVVFYMLHHRTIQHNHSVLPLKKWSCSLIKILTKLLVKWSLRQLN